jgi:glycerol-3-phosphate dehydrogenase (NAD(P)+)
MNNKVAVLGAGSWGNTLALVLANKFNVTMWEFDASLAQLLATERENKRFLPGVAFPETLTVTNDMEQAIKDAFMVVFAVPSFAIRSTAKNAANFVNCEQILVTVTKGLEDKTFLRMSQILDEVILAKKGVVALSGPTHAEEVSKKMPSTIVAACPNLELAEIVQRSFMTEYLRVYTNEDIAGVELGGAIKNIIAVIAGISDGMGMGDNTKAALMTRGMAELIRLGKKAGAKEKTFSGLTGMGDLIVTCCSRHSRNRFVGEELGKGRKLKEIIDSMQMVAEGVKNCESIYHYAKELQVEMPLTNELYKILYLDGNIHDSIRNLFGRKERYEHWE